MYNPQTQLFLQGNHNAADQPAGVLVPAHVEKIQVQAVGLAKTLNRVALDLARCLFHRIMSKVAITMTVVWDCQLDIVQFLSLKLKLHMVDIPIAP